MGRATRPLFLKIGESLESFLKILGDPFASAWAFQPRKGMNLDAIKKHRFGLVFPVPVSSPLYWIMLMILR